MPVDGPQYPVNLLLAGRPCLVVGGGRRRPAKVEGLLDCRGDGDGRGAPTIVDELAGRWP